MVYTVIVLYPLIDGLIISFFDWSGLTAHRDFVGTANYQKAWENRQLLLKAFGNDMFFAVCRIVCVATISFFFAEVICRMQLEGKRLLPRCFLLSKRAFSRYHLYALALYLQPAVRSFSTDCWKRSVWNRGPNPGSPI